MESAGADATLPGERNFRREWLGRVHYPSCSDVINEVVQADPEGEDPFIEQIFSDEQKGTDAEVQQCGYEQGRTGAQAEQRIGFLKRRDVVESGEKSEQANESKNYCDGIDVIPQE